ncbi:MAG: 4Fe-4S dicluster domain-containing protein [Bacillota bacterium]|jgi:heterodisulfide reductase subunit C
MRVIAGEESLRTDPGFLGQVKEKSGQPIELCYQCQKCASGCPMVEYFEYTPNQIIRMVHFGLKDRVLKSPGIWLCSGCETCGVRCPNGIRISEVMDVLRSLAAAGKVAGDKRAEVFHRMFLDNVKSHGRVHEGMLMAKYKLKTGQLFTDLDLGFKLFKKGKLPLLPHSIKGKKHIRDIFEKVQKRS